MRAAPPVDYPISRRGLWDLAASALAGMALAVPIAWAGWQLVAARIIGVSAGGTLLASAFVMAGIAAGIVWRRHGLASSRSLRWDGAAWYELDQDGRAHELEALSVRIGFGGMALLRGRQLEDGAVRWLPLERRSTPARWHALRVVLRRSGAAAAAPASAPVADGGSR
jgi:hypothetical protein